MRVLVGAALVVGTMGDGHCANTDCDACATDFTECGGYTNSAGLAEAVTAWEALDAPTADQTNCINRSYDVAVVVAPGNEDACDATGGTWAAGSDAWTPTYDAGVKTCNNVAGTYDAANDADDVCTALFSVIGIDATWAAGSAATGTCTDPDDQVGNTEEANCNTGWAETVAAQAATCTGAGAVETNIADANTCEGDNVDAVNAVVSPAVATCQNAAGEDVTVNDGWATAGDGGAAAQEAACETEVAAVASSCANAANPGDAGTWSTDCTAVKAAACIAHYSETANADCLTPAGDDAGSASPSADASDASPASMLQVGAAVLASLAMLL